MEGNRSLSKVLEEYDRESIYLVSKETAPEADKTLEEYQKKGRLITVDWADLTGHPELIQTEGSDRAAVYVPEADRSSAAALYRILSVLPVDKRPDVLIFETIKIHKIIDEKVYAELGYYNLFYLSEDYLVFEKLSQEKALVVYHELLNQREKEAEKIKRQNDFLRDSLKSTEKNLYEVSNSYSRVLNSLSYKLTKPFRFGKEFWIKHNIRYRLYLLPFVRYPYKTVKILLTQGPVILVRRIKNKLEDKKAVNYTLITKEMRKEQEAWKPSSDIRFSILVPLYNTPIVFLKEMIQSVQAQTYTNWELCLADGSDDQHADVGDCVKEFQTEDKRIKYEKLKKNGGISENTNACIRMATGNYISLFDHDDILHPSALYETAKVIDEQGADFVYTDEAVFQGTDITKITTYHFKPDFAIDNLRANNYICHFTSFSRELLTQAGWFRKEYDGGQDHDLILRLTAQAKKIYHIRKLLYFWRSHAASTAGNLNSKPYVMKAGVNLVEQNLKDEGLEGTAENVPNSPTIYKIQYHLNEKPLVSIILEASQEDLKYVYKCVSSIWMNTEYENLQILVSAPSSRKSEYSDVKEMYSRRGVKVIFTDKKSPIELNNAGAEKAEGKYLVFLSPRVEIDSEDWVEQLLMYAQRADVGAVGLLMYYPNNTIHHAGLILGLGKNLVGCSHYRISRVNLGYMGRLCYSQDVTAVSRDCFMIRRDLFEQEGGFDTSYEGDYEDVDLCLKLEQKKLWNVFTPYAQMYYYKRFRKNRDERKAFDHDKELFKNRWQKELDKGDRFYNPNFALDLDFTVQHSGINKDL